MTPLVECVPNFSDGRHPHIINAIADAIQQAPITFLDVSSDTDHNRTVMTFIGTPEAIIEGAYLGIQAASQLIDLRQHQGVHPRIGAADVVPLIPLRDISLEACAQLAQRLGQRIGDELHLPVYLYEAAAKSPERRNLAYVRRDPFEVLSKTIQTDPDRTPDFGPKQLGTAGAVAIGARAPLIAFNAYLDTDDVEIAQAIARAIRESGGGLPYLKALGVLVNGQAQVTMNVIDYRQTGLHAILEAVRTHAQQYGVNVTHSELVGLIPRAALIDAALQALQLPIETREKILEDRIGTETGDFRELPFE